jgi:hypothetical protein
MNTDISTREFWCFMFSEVSQDAAPEGLLETELSRNRLSSLYQEGGVGIQIHRSESPISRKIWLCLSGRTALALSLRSHDRLMPRKIELNPPSP